MCRQPDDMDDCPEPTMGEWMERIRDLEESRAAALRAVIKQQDCIDELQKAICICVREEFPEAEVETDVIAVEWFVETFAEYTDPTPWCSGCGSMTARGCHCGPIASNH
jgi:hypothetical protein